MTDTLPTPELDTTHTDVPETVDEGPDLSLTEAVFRSETPDHNIVRDNERRYTR